MPSRPQAVSLAVPSPPIASTVSAPAAAASAAKRRASPGPVVTLHLRAAPDRAAAEGGARALGGEAGARVEDDDGVHATSAYTARVSSTIRSAVKRSRNRWRPAAPIASRRPRSWSTSARAAARALRVPRGHDAAGDAVFDRLRDAAGRRRHHRAPVAHRVEKARAEPFHVRGQAEHVEGGDQRVEVRAEAGEHHGLGEAERARLRAQAPARARRGRRSRTAPPGSARERPPPPPAAWRGPCAR